VGRCRFAVAAAAISWAAHASALESGGLTLETGSPDALCPELEATREIVARRLGSLVVEGRKGWRARYTIGHSPAGNPRDFVRLELFNPEGEVELLRDLPIEGDSCRTMSEVIALVLDRYFRGLVVGEQAPAEETPAPGAEREPVSNVAPRESSPSQPQSAHRLSPRVAAEYAASEARPWLGFRFNLGLAAHWEVGAGLRFGLTPWVEREPRGARIEARAASTRLSLAWTLPIAVGRLRLGPTASLTLERASTFGLAYRTDKTRAIWSGGIEAGFLVPISRSLFVEATSSLDALVPGVSGKFYVQEREVLVPRDLTLTGALAFGYAWNK